MSDAPKAKTSWVPAFAATTVMVLVTMDLFMKPVAKTALAKEFGIDAAMVQAAISIFAIVYAGLCILGGKLGDMYGKKKMYIAGLSIYGLSALITAFAWNFPVLVFSFSILRGLAVPLAVPASVSLIISNYPNESERGVAFSIYGVGAAFAGLVAPLLMGFAADNLTWRVPFGIEVLIAATGVYLSWGMRETEREKPQFDVLGTILTFISIGALILAGMLGSAYGWWDARRPFSIGGMGFNPLGLSPVAVLYGVGILFGALLLNHIYRSEERGNAVLFSLRLFDNRTFAVSSMMALIFFLLVGALPFIVPIFLQEAVGFDAAQAGMVMTAFMLGSIGAGVCSGKLVAVMQPRYLMQLAMIITVVGLLWLVVVCSPTMAVTTVIVPMIVVGLGFGTVTTQIGNVQISPLPADLQGSGSGFAEMSKEMGVGLGTAVVGSIMFSLALGGMVDKVAVQAGEQITAEERAELIIQIEDKTVPEEVDRIVAERAPNLEDLTRLAYVEAFRITLGMLVAMVLLALLIASFLPRIDPAVLAKGGGGH
jgi:MFS family permease